MAALVLGDGRRIAVEVAETRSARRRGLLGRASVDGGALLITKCRSVHTLGMRFRIDVAFLDEAMHVLRVRAMVPWRVGPVVWRARSVLEADDGAFAQWGLRPGDCLVVEP